MDLRQLRTFKEVAHHLSFTQAAFALDYAQSSVTAQIQNLEEELNTILFDRLGRRIALTDSGKRLLVYADKMLALADEAYQAISPQKEPVGTLRISAPETVSTYRLPPVFRKFRYQFPKVQLVIQALLTRDILAGLNNGEIDMAVALDQPIQQENLVVECLREEPMYVLSCPDHRLVGAARVGVAELASEMLLLTEPDCSYRAVLEDTFKRYGVYPVERMEFTSVEAIKQCVMAGIGVALLPQVSVKREVEQGRLAVLNWAEGDFGMVTQLVWHKDKWLSPALLGFMDLCRRVIQSG